MAADISCTAAIRSLPTSLRLRRVTSTRLLSMTKAIRSIATDMTDAAILNVLLSNSSDRPFASPEPPPPAWFCPFPPYLLCHCFQNCSQLYPHSLRMHVFRSHISGIFSIIIRALLRIICRDLCCYLCCYILRGELSVSAALIIILVLTIL